MQGKDATGITLMETLVVLAVIGVSAAIAAPIYVHYVNRSRLKAAAEGFYHALEQGRDEAAKRQQNVYVNLQSGSNWCYGIMAADQCDCSVASSCNIAQVDASAHDGVSMTYSGSANFNYSFVRGQASESASVTFTNGAGSISVEYNQGGRVKICASNMAGYLAC
ncbi:MAG: GspH/FimT family pseudopilin [Gammaproteobacteria bacterium]|nr:GspH/FimT family pseudopilin [Gammaproteobacteria bacterium]